MGCRMLASLMLILFLTLSVFGFLTPRSYASPGMIDVDVELLSVYDEYGFPRRNRDGTFYPGDAFKVRFNVTVGRGDDWYVSFDHLEFSYDGEAFEASGPEGISGVWSFGVKRNATAGNFSVTFKAVGRYYYWDCWTVWRTVCRKVGNETVCEEEPFTECGYVFGGYVSDKETVTVEVVPYNPEFTVLLSYLAVAKPGDTSYHKPFTVIARYEGSDGNPDRRAVIEGLEWEGFAEKVSPLPGEGLQPLNLACKVEGTNMVFNVTIWVNRTRLENFGADEDFLKIVGYEVYDSDTGLKFEWPYAWPIPLYGGDYVKVTVDPENEVMDKTLDEGFTAVYLNVTFQTYRFSLEPKNLFAVYNFTFEPEVFEQPLRFEVYRPKPDGTLVLDRSAMLNLTFTPFNMSLTTHDIYMEWARNQTDDETALKLFEEDIYDEGSQNFKGLGGVLDFTLLKKSPTLFNLTAQVFSPPKVRRLETTVLPVFHSNKTTYYINLWGGGVNVEKVRETGQYVTLNFTAIPEAGGLKNVKVYDEHGNLLYNETLWMVQQKPYILPENIRKVLGEAGFRLPEGLKIPAVTSTVFLGWSGNRLLYIPKNPETREHLLVVTENIWGAETVRKVEVNPYTSPEHLEMFGQIRWVAAYLALAAVVAGFIAWVRRRVEEIL